MISPCGYGCVICGNAIYQYEHIDPPFWDAREHNSEKIALLCGACHDNVTRGIWSKEKIFNARKQPFCCSSGTSSLNFDIQNGDGFIVKIGNSELVNISSIIKIDNVDLLTIKPPETEYSPPLICAKFYDRNSTLVAEINNNEWVGYSTAFDIETKGSTITIRSADRKLDLILNITPPNILHIEQLHMYYNNKVISGNSKVGFSVSNSNAKINIPTDLVKLDKAPFWLSISDQNVCLGSDCIIDYITLNGESQKLAGFHAVENAELTFLDPEKDGIEPPPGMKPGEKIMRITTNTNNMNNSLHIGVSINQPKAVQQTSQIEQLNQKISRNQPCTCGSGLRYKHCCGKP